MDEHVSLAITIGLKMRNVDVVTALEVGARGWDDPDLLRLATEQGRVLFTHDQDFLVHGPDWQKRGIPFAGIIYVHQQSANIGMCIEELSLMATWLEPEEVADRILFVPYC
ncbi:MAG: DUF5615 family PIN-like protein [Candidatus Xenobia bacterium]